MTTRLKLDLTPLAAAVVLTVGLAGCAANAPDDTHAAVSGLEQDIISVAKTSDESIDRLGLVVVDDGSCSGVLVGARSILTARHCQADVGSRVSFRGEVYTATQSFEPPSAYDTKWGPRDVEVLVLDRDVVYPGTTTPWSPELPIWTYDLNAQVGAKLLCFGIGAHEVANGVPVPNTTNEYYGNTLTVAAVEDGASYRVVPGTEFGDSGGPCFAPIWWNSQNEYALMSINSTGVRDVHEDGTEGPGVSAALVATGETQINAWINDHIR